MVADVVAQLVLLNERFHCGNDITLCEAVSVEYADAHPAALLPSTASDGQPACAVTVQAVELDGSGVVYVD